MWWEQFLISFSLIQHLFCTTANAYINLANIYQELTSIEFSNFAHYFCDFLTTASRSNLPENEWMSHVKLAKVEGDTRYLITQATVILIYAHFKANFKPASVKLVQAEPITPEH